MAQKIVIIGGGFSGCLVASHLLKRAAAPLDVTLVEKAAVGRGAAYSTKDPAHLLNVPAQGMSAFPDDPNHFLRWLGDAQGGDFISRGRFGDYILSILKDAQDGAAPGVTFRALKDEAVDVRPEGEGLRVVLRSGGELPAKQIVLALGNAAPSPPYPALADLGARFIADPWDGGRLSGIEPDAAVMLIGTGLTMVDVAIALSRRGHRGPMFAFSRRGLLPQPHGEGRAVDSFPPAEAAGRTARGVLRWIRRQDNWRGAMDALRPRVQELWFSLSPAERRRFLRHARPYWDSHRHRLPPQAHAALAALLKSGQLRTFAGRIDSLTPAGADIRTNLRLRGGTGIKTLEANWIVNCAGPESNPARSRDPLIVNLLARGLARPDALSLGFDADEDGALVRGDGRVDKRIFTLGTWLKGRLWESVAVPELRGQAQDLAARLLRVSGERGPAESLADAPLDKSPN
ncbi:MAG TPA: FAD-dependent oxidoreductase [Elusimicrobiota bacterium]|nr:FAD-dependent oxidoreductase [Elusimicrobiota bacterium]